MRTNLLPTAPASVAWLERDVPGQPSERIELDRLPFTVGRNESCDYQIHSTRVSREHAEFVRERGVFRLRDLKSTNGTLVNGKRIDEHRLVDGDLIVIADVHFSFRSNRGDSARKTVTQVMDESVSHPERAEDPAGDLILAVRRTHERVLHRAIHNRFQPIFDLAENRCVGYDAILSPPAAREDAPAQQALSATDCRINERLRELHRHVAAEQIARLPQATLLFLALEPAEVGADALPESLTRVVQMAGGKTVIAQIPDSAVVDIPYFRDFRARLRDLGIGVAYEGFAGSPHQIKAHAEFAPDYLKLATALARGIDKSSQRQEQVKAIVGAAAEQGVRAIASGVHTEAEALVCREIGFRFAQGDHFGRAQTADWPLIDAALAN